MVTDSFQIGAHFHGLYRIDGKLGKGGFGSVFLATQLSSGRQVALKVMNEVPDEDPALLERLQSRFQREMELCARLHHPNIVPFVDSGVTADGQLFAVFQYVPGVTLAHRLRSKGPLDRLQARHLMLQLLDALSCAHAAGIVHRDLKPENVMVTETGARPNAQILDFGIGALVNEAGPRLTRTGELVGTPAYAAPEQVDDQPVGPATDLYAWGLVYAECLTGMQVIQGSVAQVLWAHGSDAQVPLPDVVTSLPEGALIARAVEKEAAARPAGASALLDALERIGFSSMQDLLLPMEVTTLRPAEQRRWAAPTDDTMVRRGGPREERRPMTAVSCGLALRGATGEDPEALDRVMSLFQAICHERAAHHHGHLASVLGDRVLVYFGYPEAAEDDTRRAARFALDVIEDVANLNVAGFEPAARAGIHSGLTVVHHSGLDAPSAVRDVVGEPAALAAALDAVAEPGTALVTADVERLIRGHFVLDGRQRRPVGSVRAELTSFELFSETASELAGIEEMGPMVGRDRELGELLRRFERAEDGAGQAVMVSGEAGMGKSRLVLGLLEKLESERFTRLVLRCAPQHHAAPFSPVVRLFESLLGFEGIAPELRQAEVEGLLARLELDADELMPLLGPLLGVPFGERSPPDASPQRQKELLLEGLVELFCELSGELPVLLLAKDLHWADPSTLELVDRLAREIDAASMMLLATARPETEVEWASSSGALHLRLEQLGPSEVEAIATRVAGGKQVPRAVLDEVAARAGGVPLYVETVVRELIESEALVARGEGLELAAGRSVSTLPISLHASFAARLDRLSPGARAVAQLLAAAGPDTDETLLAAVWPGSAPQLAAGLDELLSGEFVRRRRRARRKLLSFRHALLGDASYASMVIAEREGLHARLAIALREQAPELAERQPSLLAFHLSRAGERAEAVPFALAGARKALERSANAETAEQCREALAWVPEIPEGSARVDAELGLNGTLAQALMATRGWGDAEIGETMARSEALLEAHPESPHAGPTWWGSMVFHHVQGDRERAREIAEHLVAGARAREDVGTEVAALPQLAQCLWIEGRFAEARAAIERADTLYDEAAHGGHAFMFGLDSKAYADVTASQVEWFLGHPELAVARAQAGLSRARATGHASTLGHALMYAAMMRQQLDDREGGGGLREGVGRSRRSLRAPGPRHVWRHARGLGVRAARALSNLRRDPRLLRHRARAHLLSGDFGRGGG